jgi:hypothetical protein
LIDKIKEFNLETHFAFVDYGKVFDKVKWQKRFNILKEKNTPNPLLKNILEIYTNNTIRIKISNNTTVERVINHGVRQGCPLSPTLYIRIYIHIWDHQTLEWKMHYRNKNIKWHKIKYHIICRWPRCRRKLRR